MKTSFAYNGSVLWNNLPTDLRCIDNFNIFQKVLKSYLILNVPLTLLMFYIFILLLLLYNIFDKGPRGD